MNEHAENLSYWVASTRETSFPRLEREVSVDIAIVGAGIVGVTAACLLHAQDVSVALIEAHQVAASVTGYTTAKITSQHGAIYDHLISTVGEDKARIYAASNQHAITMIQQLAAAVEIDCDLETRDNYVYADAGNDKQLRTLQMELEAAQILGLPAEWCDVIPIGVDIAGAVRFTGQAQFHPRKYLLGLVDYLSTVGVPIFESSRVTEVEDGPICTVKTEQASVRAKRVILATHTPFQYGGEYFAKSYPHRGYVVAAPFEGDVDGMYINAGPPTRSVRTAVTQQGRILLVGGAGHKTGEENYTTERYEQLEQWGRENFGDTLDFTMRWSTQDFTSTDLVPFVGKLTSDSDRMLVATAFGSWGMTNGTVAAAILSDMARGVDNGWLALYDSTRTLPLLKSATMAVKENLKAAGHLITDRFGAGSGPALSEIPAGHGAVVEVDGKKVAAYRDKSGTIHAVSAVCTHMGCDVAFNDAETTWDCPCHGSRFTTSGEVVEGPAVDPLAPVDVDSL